MYPDVPLNGSKPARLVHSVVARNQDDHVKNIAFLMDKRGIWQLAPAFDVMYSFNPLFAWTSRHQMTINGKQDGFTRSDFEKCAEVARISPSVVRAILAEVIEAVSNWSVIASDVGIPDHMRIPIGKNHRLIFQNR